MFRRTRRTFLALLLSAAICLPSYTQAAGKCFLWKVQSQRATVYLLGSMHMGEAKMYPLDKTIEDAFASSDHLVLEVNMGPENQAKALGLILAKATYDQGDTLQSKLSRNTYGKLADYLKKQEQPVDAMSKFRPWFVMLQLLEFEMAKLGFSPAFGIENHLMSHVGSKTILELETIEEQLNLLSSGTDMEQELDMIDGLEQLPRTEILMKRMVDAWINGDVAAMDRIITESLPKSTQLQKRNKSLLDDRNINMARKIEEYLKTDKTYFVTVGSAHLTGKKSIISLLQAKGYRPNQMNKS